MRDLLRYESPVDASVAKTPEMEERNLVNIEVLDQQLDRFMESL